MIKNMINTSYNVSYILIIIQILSFH